MDQSVPTPAIPATQLPLSVNQEAMWVTWQLAPARWEHTVSLALVVDGELELPRLRRAVAQLMRRHPELRSRVARGAEGMMCLDWSGTTEETVPVTVREVDTTRTAALAAARVPFDLAAGPLSRVELLTGPDWTVLLIAVHHITVDGTSVTVLLDELRRAYAGEQLAPPDDLTPLIEHARRSRAAADGASGEPLRSYWREALAELPAPRLLPDATDPADAMDAADAADGAEEASKWPVPVEPELAERVRELAVELGVSTFTVLLGAFFVTLHHHTGSADLIVSTPYHGRPDAELKGRVGYFVNTLPLRQRIRPEDSYADLLRELRATIRAGLRHGALPLPAILRSANLLGPARREQNRQVVFRHWNTLAEDGFDVSAFELVGDGTRCSVSMLDPTTVTNFRLTVLMTEGSGGLRMHWMNSDGSVDRTTTDTLARDYLTVIADLVAAPNRTLAEALALLPAVSHPGVAPALAAPADPEQLATVTVAAATIAEVGAIWTEVLRVPDLLPADSFFELGGHSLIAATLLARINERLGVEISIRDLFSHPRLVDIAGLVDRQRGAAPLVTVVEPAQGEDESGSEGEEWGEVFPAAGFQEGIWLAQRLDPKHARYHIPLTWRVDGELDPERLRAALALLVTRHEILRTRFVDHDGRLFQEVGPAWEPEVEEVESSTTTAAEQRKWLRGWCDGAADRFDAAAGRLLAAGLFTLPSGERLLALCVHHLVLDGESVPLLLRELTSCYQQAGEDRAQPAEPVQRRQYRELVRAQQVGAGRVQATADLAYWADQLAGAPSTLGLNGAATLAPGSTALPLASDLAQRLLPVQQHWRASQFMVKATALAAALHRWSGQHDLTFGVPVANRAGGAFDEVLGPCLNTVVLRSRCTPGTTLAELLRATRESAIEAFEHQSAPFDEVVRRLRPARSAGRTPYVDCMLNNVSIADWSGTLGAARLTSLDHDLQDETTNKFGLTVTFNAREEGRLLGTLAYRSGILAAEAAGQLAAEVAGLLNHFQQLADQPVLSLDPTGSTGPTGNTGPTGSTGPTKTTETS